MGLAMSDPKILNSETLARVEGIKAGLVVKLVETFLRHAPGRFAHCRQGMKSSDWTAVGEGAHSLKSSAGHLGADRLLEICDRMERLAEAGNCADLLALEDEFASVYAGTITALEEEKPRWVPKGN